MRRLIFCEIKKVWQSRVFSIALAALLCLNLFMLWVTTSPMNGTFSSHAYKAMQRNLQGLTMSQTQSFVAEETRRATALLSIESVLRSEAYNNGIKAKYAREQYKAEFAEFYHIYAEGGYLKYNQTLVDEYKFLTKIKAECETVAGYNSFLDDIKLKATQLSSISIFAQSSDGYGMKNIEKTAKAYENIRGIDIEYFPQMGVYTALDFELTDLIAVFAMLLIATVLVRAERDNGLLRLVRATPSGRVKTAIAKLITLCASLGVVLILLYGVNLLYCNAVYGLGDLSRSIQSVPALMRSTLTLSIGQYFGVFFLTKWVAAIVAGVFVMLCMLVARRAFTGYTYAMLFLTGNLLLRSIIPATSNLNVIKYANLVSLLRTNELIGGYRNLYFFSSPVSIWVVEGITAFVCLIVFTLGFCIVFCKAQLLDAEQFNIKLPFSFRPKPTTVFRKEWKKLLLMNGTLLFISLFLGYQIYNVFTTQSYINPDEIYYSYYMKMVQGPITAEKLDILREAYKEFEPIITLQNQYSRGEIDVNTMTILMYEHSGLQQKMIAFDRVWYSQAYLYEHPRSQFVYEAGWLKLFDINANGNNNRLDALVASLLSAVCFAGFFAMEKQSGMERIIAATPLGRRVTVKAKLHCTTACCIALAVISSIPPYAIAMRDFGLGALFAPSYSIAQFDGMVELPLLFYLFLFLAARFLAILTMASVTLALSYKFGNMFSALFVSSGIFGLPLMLSISGLDSAKWLSVYPLFNACAMFTKKGETICLMLIMVILVFIIWRCIAYLHDKFGNGASE